MGAKESKPLVLKRERERKNYSLRDLGNMIGVDRSTVSYWEHGIKTPRQKNKIKLVRIFGMTIEELLSEDEN